MRRSIIPLVLLAALSFFVGLGRGAITDADEAFYAESAREMVVSGDWLTPHYNFEPRFQKPALYYWLASATYLITGPNEVGARIWSAFAGLGLVLIIAAAGRRWFDEDTGLLAGAIGATNFGYFAMARMALPDLPLTFFITLAIYAALVAFLERERHPRRWLLVAAVAAGLGFLTKGPVGLIIPALVVIPVVLLERRSTHLRLADLVVALLVFLLVAVPWYVAMFARHGMPYLQGFFVGDNVERFATSRFNDPRPWWFYLPVLAGGLLPWTPLMTVWLAPLRQFLFRRRDIDTLDMRLLMWAVLPLIFYTLSVGKQPRYVLPVLPPLALLLAGSIIERTRDWRTLDGARYRPRARSMAVVIGSLLSGLFLVGLAFLMYRAQSLFVDVGDAFTMGSLIAIGVMGGLVVVISLSSAWRLAPAMIALAGAVTFALLPYGVLSAPQDSTVKRLAAMVRDANTGGEAIGTYRVFVRNLVMYSGRKTVDLINDDQLQAFVTQNANALVVLPREDMERLQRERALRFEPVGSLRYFDDGQIKVGTLLQPNPEEDLRTVVLARVR